MNNNTKFNIKLILVVTMIAVPISIIVNVFINFLFAVYEQENRIAHNLVNKPVVLTMSDPDSDEAINLRRAQYFREQQVNQVNNHVNDCDPKLGADICGERGLIGCTGAPTELLLTHRDKELGCIPTNDIKKPDIISIFTNDTVWHIYGNGTIISVPQQEFGNSDLFTRQLMEKRYS